jgi:hypothetical protein
VYVWCGVVCGVVACVRVCVDGSARLAMVAVAVAMVAVTVVEAVDVVVVVVVTVVVAATAERRQWLPRAAYATCIDTVVSRAVSGACENLAADAGVAGAENVAATGEPHREQRGGAMSRALIGAGVGRSQPVDVPAGSVAMCELLNDIVAARKLRRMRRWQRSGSRASSVGSGAIRGTGHRHVAAS